MPRSGFIFIFVVIQAITLIGQTPVNSGKKEGYVRKKDEKTNRVIYEGTFKNDVPVGRFKYYYPNDSIRAILDFRNDGKTAYARLFHMNGKKMGEGKYINREIKDSTWTYYDEAGVVLSRERYKAGKKDGGSFVYLPDGSLAEERNYKDDVQHGQFRQYFGDKSLKASGNYVKGQLDGKVSYFYPNGIEVAAGYYKNGQKNGPWLYKYEDGKVKEKELYHNGKKASDKETLEFFQKNKPAEIKPGTPQKGSAGKSK